MIRVLHFSDPEDARHRIRFLGAAEEDANRLVSDLRAFLVSVSLGDEISQFFPELLRGGGVPHARGRDVLLFSVSSKEQWDRISKHVPAPGNAFTPVWEAIDRYQTREHTLRIRDRSLPLSGAPRIMGILNVTPDSFSDGGNFLSVDSAVEHGETMAREGADIIDVGGESTRPGSAAVSTEVELARVIPVLRELSGRTDTILSIDTTKAHVARQAIAAGAHIVNDTSALSDDPEMAGVVRDAGCAVVLMHRHGIPETMQHEPSYGSLFEEILTALSERIEAAEAAGIPGDRIMIDPGIGFGKRLADNLALHRHLSDLRNLGKPILFGPSRKSFIGKLTGREPGDRINGTLASVAVAVLGGAHVLRVHDVKETKEAICVADAVKRGTEC